MSTSGSSKEVFTANVSAHDIEHELKRIRVKIVRRDFMSKLSLTAAIAIGVYLGSTIGSAINDYANPASTAAGAERDNLKP